MRQPNMMPHRVSLGLVATPTFRHDSHAVLYFAFLVTRSHRSLPARLGTQDCAICQTIAMAFCQDKRSCPLVSKPWPLMVLITVPYFDRLQRSLLFRRALRGILASFVGLLLAVAVHFAIAVPWDRRSVPLALAAFVALRLKADVLWVVLVGAGLGVFFL